MRNSINRKVVLERTSNSTISPCWWGLCLGLLILPSIGVAQVNHIESATRLLSEGNVKQAETEARQALGTPGTRALALAMLGDRKSTRLNSSHSQISYAVFCLKKKTKIQFTHY